METILYVGNRMSGYFAEELANERGFCYEQIDVRNNDIKLSTNDIMTKVYQEKIKVDIIIFNVDEYLNPANEIAKQIDEITKAIEAKPIIYMAAFLPESEMAKQMISVDIKNFIFAGTKADLKDQLIKNITRYYDVNVRKEIAKTVQIMEEAQMLISDYHSIAVAGTQPRIGTTTQALQIVKYLQAKGHRACYVELNQNKYFDLSARDGRERSVGFVAKYDLWTESIKENCVSYLGVDMYEAEQGLKDHLKKEYDYFVYDYGTITDRDFDRTAFMKDEVRLLVGGGKPPEFDNLETALYSRYYDDCGIIISFVTDKDKDGVSKLIYDVRRVQGIEPKPIIYADYAADPFGVPNIELYEKLLPVEMTEEKEKELLSEVKPKKRLFGRKKKEKELSEDE